jgi:hypothetical protein
LLLQSITRKMTACYQLSCNKLHKENALPAIDEI